MRLRTNNPVAVFADGRREVVSFDKITSRIQKLCYGLNSDFVDPVSSKHYKVAIIKILST